MRPLARRERGPCLGIEAYYLLAPQIEDGSKKLDTGSVYYLYLALKTTQGHYLNLFGQYRQFIHASVYTHAHRERYPVSECILLPEELITTAGGNPARVVYLEPGRDQSAQLIGFLSFNQHAFGY